MCVLLEARNEKQNKTKQLYFIVRFMVSNYLAYTYAQQIASTIFIRVNPILEC